MTRPSSPRADAPPVVNRSTRLIGLLPDVVVSLIGLGLVVLVATLPLTPSRQAVFALITFATFMIANRFKSRAVTAFLVALSLSVSLRYIVWRVTQTLSFSNVFELILGTILALAEVYAITVLVLGYIQTTWPLERAPVPLPDDTELWPHVDVFVPTYNEPLDIVRATVLAAMRIDWPPGKMHLYILDDGKRAEFRDFAIECGVGYITRRDNAHAKAGNLNNALTQTDSPFILVFDSDHIATRAFLQFTMGWMLRDPNMALVQTPHHFYSPDPFQRNLTSGARVPAEGNMFYGLVQDGNDYWNACFFCGSCAILRRAALDDIGGFAIETVTEDAHTMLKMARRGWNSSFIKLPLAAGLATERLALHIGQRFRWARGMLQIFRIDNPLFGPGLSIGQRICYLQATGHFLFALPRVIFLCAPLCYLLLNANVIAASPLAIVGYALPHIVHAIATNSRLQRSWRHSFWSEIYETVLALFIVPVTVVTLASPKRGKFNVTAKGGLLENGFFDLRAVYPNLFLALFLIAGIIRGISSMVFIATPRLVFQALLLNTVWATLSLLIVLAALAVGREARQLRSRARVETDIPATIYLPDGRLIAGSCRDLSQGGGSFIVPRPQGVANASELTIEVAIGTEPILMRAAMLRWERETLQVRFAADTIAEESRVVQAVFSRADAWVDWGDYTIDHPMVSLWRVIQSIGGLFRPPDRSAPQASPGPAEGLSTPAAAPPPRADAYATGLRAPARAMALLAAALLANAAIVAPARAQNAIPVGTDSQETGATAAPGTTDTTTVRPLPQPVDNINSAAPLAPTQFPPAAPGVVTQPPPAAAPAPVTPAAPAASVRTLVLTLKQMGATGPLELRGTSELQGVQFGVRADEVVTGAELHLIGATSPRIIPQFSNDTITLNEQYVGEIPVDPAHPPFDVKMPISPVFFQDNNKLNFRFTGRYAPNCYDPLSGLLWSTIYDYSTLTLTLERLPPQRDLSRLPLPFFDSHENTGLVLPFVLASAPSDGTLKAAAIAASWFGQLADYRGARFPVMDTPPASGNAVVIVSADNPPAGIVVPALAGPTLSVIANPNDPFGSLLVVAGRTSEEAISAARTLALTYRALGGPSALVAEPKVPDRVPYDAPAWISTTRAVRLGELVDAATLQGYGYTGVVHVPFRTAPDFFTWRNASFPQVLRFRTPSGPIVDVAPSRLDVSINGLYLQSFSLATGQPNESWWSRTFGFGARSPASRLGVPAYDVFGQNELQYFFDMRPLHRGDCVAIPQDLRQAIDPDSTIDLSGGYRFTRLPNLAYFVSSGFPYTRMADLSRTVVVVPDQADPVELGAFLTMMGRFGGITNYPVTNVTVARPEELDGLSDKDVLLIGSIPRLGNAASLLARAPLRFDGDHLDVDLPTQQTAFDRLFSHGRAGDRARAAATLATDMTPTTAVLVGAESPMHDHRSVVAILASTSHGLDDVVSTFRDSTRSPLIQGDLSLLGGDQVTSYRVGDTYTVGTLPLWLWPGYLLNGNPLADAVIMIIGCLLLGAALFWALRRRARKRVHELYEPK